MENVTADNKRLTSDDSATEDLTEQRRSADQIEGDIQTPCGPAKGVYRLDQLLEAMDVNNLPELIDWGLPVGKEL